MVTKIPHLFQVAAPASEPLTLTEAKLYLRVDANDDDTVINRLISAARRRAEFYMRRSLITQTWKLTYDDYAPSSVELPRGPVQSVSSVKTVDSTGTETVIDNSAYYLTAGNGKLIFGASVIGRLVEVSYITGYGDVTVVPEQIKQGLLAHVAKMYEDRDGTLEPDGVTRSLYDDYRLLGL